MLEIAGNMFYYKKIYCICNLLIFSFQQEFFEHYHYGWNITSDKECHDIYPKVPAENAYLRMYFNIVL